MNICIKSRWTMLGCAILAVCLFAGCSNSGESGSQQTPQATLAPNVIEQAAATGALTAQVESIAGSNITARLGELESMQPREDASGDWQPQGSNQPPEMPSGEGGARPMPSGFEGERGGALPTMPEGGLPGGSRFVAGEESINFSITENTAITIENFQGSEQGDISSIAVGAVLEVILDADNNATQIVVKHVLGGGFRNSDTITNDSTTTNGV